MILSAIESEITIIQEYGLDCLDLIWALHKELAVEYVAIFSPTPAEGPKKEKETSDALTWTNLRFFIVLVRVVLLPGSE